MLTITVNQIGRIKTLKYEENRTEDIIQRLITIGRVIRYIVIAVCIVVFLSIFTLLGMTFSKETAAAMALLGGVGGYIVGKYIAALITVTMEWYAQVLVGLENAINLMKTKY